MQHHNFHRPHFSTGHKSPASRLGGAVNNILRNYSHMHGYRRSEPLQPSHAFNRVQNIVDQLAPLTHDLDCLGLPRRPFFRAVASANPTNNLDLLVSAWRDGPADPSYEPASLLRYAVVLVTPLRYEEFGRPALETYVGSSPLIAARWRWDAS
jgi:hypothetical protein